MEPVRIDLVTGVDGCEFGRAWRSRVKVRIEGVTFYVLGINDLIRTRRAVGRPPDLSDIERLRVSRKRSGPTGRPRNSARRKSSRPRRA